MKPEPVRSVIKWGISSQVTRPLVGRRFFSPAVPVDYRNQFLDEYGRADSFSQMFDIITPSGGMRLEPVDVPALMLWGSNDRVLGADQVADYRALLPAAPGSTSSPAGATSRWSRARRVRRGDRPTGPSGWSAAGRRRCGSARACSPPRASARRPRCSTGRSLPACPVPPASVLTPAGSARRGSRRIERAGRRAVGVLVGGRRDHVERRALPHRARRRRRRPERVQLRPSTTCERQPTTRSHAPTCW